MWYPLCWNSTQVKIPFLIAFAKYDLSLPFLSFNAAFFSPKRRIASSCMLYFLL